MLPVRILIKRLTTMFSGDTSVCSQYYIHTITSNTIVNVDIDNSIYIENSLINRCNLEHFTITHRGIMDFNNTCNEYKNNTWMFVYKYI